MRLEEILFFVAGKGIEGNIDWIICAFAGILVLLLVFLQIELDDI